MRKIAFIILLSGLFSLNAYAQNPANDAATQAVPESFTGDGCTFFPDGAYLDCCQSHDRAYYAGGSWTARWRADKKLFKCVAAKKGWWNKPIAPIMWAGVRLGGVPFLPTSFRWGFGRKRLKKSSSSPNSCQKKIRET